MDIDTKAVKHIPMYRKDEIVNQGYPTGFRAFAIVLANMVRIVFYPSLLLLLYLLFNGYLVSYFEYMNQYVHEHVLLAILVGFLWCILLLYGMTFSPYPEYGEIVCFDDGTIRLARSSKHELLNRELSRLPVDKVIHDKSEYNESYFLLLSAKNILSISVVIDRKSIKNGESIYGNPETSPFVGGVLIIAIHVSRLYVHSKSIWSKFTTIGNKLINDTVIYTSVDSTDSYTFLKEFLQEPES